VDAIKSRISWCFKKYEGTQIFSKYSVGEEPKTSIDSGETAKQNSEEITA